MVRVLAGRFALKASKACGAESPASRAWPMIYDGGARYGCGADAAVSGHSQVIRDLGAAFAIPMGLYGLIDRKASGPSPKLNDAATPRRLHTSFENGPTSRRPMCVDGAGASKTSHNGYLEEFRISLDETTVGRVELKCTGVRQDFGTHPASLCAKRI